MNDPRKFTKEQVDKMIFKISSLDQHQREVMRDHLHKLLDHGGGTLYDESTHLALMKMQNAGKISEIDRQNVEDALFG
jgi:hypothetical protein